MFLDALPAAADGADDIGWTVSVDSTVVRAHRPLLLIPRGPWPKLRRRQIRAVIPQPSDHIAHRLRRGRHWC
jgi:hypothetical protein